MALSGLDIYKLLPKTNCKECGFATCLAFAMALAQKKVSLDKCPHITQAAREALDSASQPPVKLVTIGTGNAAVSVGNETVMYRHEQKFFHPTAIGVIIDDTLSDSAIDEKIKKISALKFERVGVTIKPELICIRNSSQDKEKFLRLAQKAAALPECAVVIASTVAENAKKAVSALKSNRPLLLCMGGAATNDFILLAKETGLPLGVTCNSLEEAADITERAKKDGVGEIVINMSGKTISLRIEDYTYARRAALKKSFRPLGYPFLAFTSSDEPLSELCEAVSYVLKYAGVVLVNNCEKDFILPLLVSRQDVFADPQKPVQVEPKVYEIGKVNNNSPLLVTTNFSITYFTVAGEVEGSKVPSYILCCDSEGMSVLTAWAAEKFTAEKIADTLVKIGADKLVAHKKVIIPGYVSILSGKLAEVSGWNIVVGPREASGIPNFLKGWK